MIIASLKTTTMRPIIIESEEEFDNYEAGCYFDQHVFYKGERFNGCIENRDELIPYVNGNIHGKSIGYFENGTIKHENFYEDGIYLKQILYNEDGKVVHIKSSNSLKIWTPENKLIYEDGVSYFQNGKTKSISSPNHTSYWEKKYFNKKGNLIYTKLRQTFNGNNYSEPYSYEDDVLSDCYYELLSVEENGLNNHSDYQGFERERIIGIWNWLRKMSIEDPNRYFEIANMLMKHPDEQVYSTIASHIAHKNYQLYIEKENIENTKTYDLIRNWEIYLSDEKKVKENNLISNNVIINTHTTTKVSSSDHDYPDITTIVRWILIAILLFLTLKFKFSVY